MERKYIYIIVVLLSVTLVVSNYYINRSLDNVENQSIRVDTSNSLGIDDDLLGDTYNAVMAVAPFTISNIQNDEKEEVYTYNIRINDAQGTYLYNKNGEEGYIVFSARGETSLQLKSNQTITIYDVPNDSYYTVSQSLNKDYKTYINNKETNSVEGIVSSENNVNFINNALNVTEMPSEEPTETKPPAANPSTADIIYICLSFLGLSVLVIIWAMFVKVKRFK